MLLTWRCIGCGFFNGSDDGFDQQLLVDGTTLRILTVMDEFTREGLTLDVALTTSAERVISVLTVLVAQHGAPAYA